MIYEFIEVEKAADDRFSIQLACQVLEVSRSGFYDSKARQDRASTAREREQAQLVAEIEMIHQTSGGNYGSPGGIPGSPAAAGGIPHGVRRAG